MPRPLSAFRFVLRPPPTSTTSSTSTGRFARCSSLVGPSSPSSFSVLRSSFSTFFSVRPSFLFRQSTRGQRSETKEKREPEPGRRAATKRRVRKGAGRLRDREHRHTQHKEPTINHCNPLKKKRCRRKHKKKNNRGTERTGKRLQVAGEASDETTGEGQGQGQGTQLQFRSSCSAKIAKKTPSTTTTTTTKSSCSVFVFLGTLPRARSSCWFVFLSFVCLFCFSMPSASSVASVCLFAAENTPVE